MEDLVFTQPLGDTTAEKNNRFLHDYFEGNSPDEKIAHVEENFIRSISTARVTDISLYGIRLIIYFTI